MQINTLVIIGFIVIAFMALEDIAVDGWIVSLISKENFSVGGAFQRISNPFSSTNFELL